MDLTDLTEEEWDAIEEHLIDGYRENIITLLLVLDGVKPGSEFIVRRNSESNKSTGEFLEHEKENHYLLSILTNHEIPHLIRMEIQENLGVHNEPKLNVFYSLDENVFHLLSTPTNEKPSTGEGEFFGFPDKSVEAFEEDTHIKSNTPRLRRFLYRFLEEYSVDSKELAFLEVAPLAPAPETQSLYEKWSLGKEYTKALLDISERFEKEFIKEMVKYTLIDKFRYSVQSGRYGIFEMTYSVTNSQGAKTENTVYIPATTSENAKKVIQENEREFIFKTYMSPDMAEISSISGAFCSRNFRPTESFITNEMDITQEIPTMTIEEIEDAVQ